MCVLVTIKVRGHLVMSIIQVMNLISVQFWKYLSSERGLGGAGRREGSRPTLHGPLETGKKPGLDRVNIIIVLGLCVSFSIMKLPF